MQIASTIFFVLAACLYGTAAVLYIHRSAKRTDRHLKLARLLFFAAFVLHAVTIGLFSVMNKGTVLGGGNILMLSSWALAGIYLIFELIFKNASYGAFALPAVLVTMMAAFFIGLYTTPDVYVEVYRSWPILTGHVGAFILSAACFLISGIASVMLLYQSHQLKKRNAGFMDSKLPSLSSLKKIAGRSVAMGLPIFSVGLLLGIIHSFAGATLVTVGAPDISTYISPRIIFSLILWALYVFYLAAIYFMNLSTRKLSWISIVGAASIVILSFMSSTLPMLNG